MTPLLSIDGLIYWYKGEAKEFPHIRAYPFDFRIRLNTFLRDCVLCEDQDRAKELIALEETNKTPYQIQDRTLYFVDVEFEEVEQYRTALFEGIDWSYYDPKLNGPKDSEDFDYRAVARIKDKKEESQVTRVEVIDQNGRSYVNWDIENMVELSYQDGGRTLKVFITRKP